MKLRADEGVGCFTHDACQSKSVSTAAGRKLLALSVRQGKHFYGRPCEPPPELLEAPELLELEIPLEECEEPPGTQI